MELKGKKVLVFGSGISGEAAAVLLDREGADIVLYDGNEKLDADRIKSEILEKAVQCGGHPSGTVSVVLGEFPERMLDELDLTVMSPGVPTDLPVVEKMREMGIPVWGEIELAYVCGKGDVLAITGTNGKTTTTSLLGQIMKNYKESVFVVGNIGNPYTSVAMDTTGDSVIVAEMSSFQLETVHSFRPRVSAILNITPDHLNRHHTMEAYIAAKERIAENQTSEDYCVLNYEDDVLREFGEKVDAQVLYFSSRRKLNRGVYLDGKTIICQIGEPVSVCDTDELQILGTHNYENAMAVMPVLITFIPMLMGTGGNCGSQSSTLMIRGLAVGEIEFKDIFKVIFKEIRVALIVGALLAVVNGIRICIMYDWNVMLAVALGITMIAVVIMAKCIGCVLPLLARKIGLDPAIMAAPLITTVLDTCTILVYFNIVTAFFKI